MWVRKNGVQMNSTSTVTQKNWSFEAEIYYAPLFEEIESCCGSPLLINNSPSRMKTYSIEGYALCGVALYKGGTESTVKRKYIGDSQVQHTVQYLTFSKRIGKL